MKFQGKKTKTRVFCMILAFVLLVSGIYVGNRPQSVATETVTVASSEDVSGIFEKQSENIVQEIHENETKDMKKEEPTGFVKDHVTTTKPVQGGQKLPVLVEETTQSIATAEIGKDSDNLPTNELSTSQEIVDEKAEEEQNQERILNKGEERLSDFVAEQMPKQDEIVDFVVVMEQEALLDRFSQQEINDNTAEVENYTQIQEAELQKLEDKLVEAFGEEDGFQRGFWYTIANTGLSVKTAYKNKEAIENMKGVDRVYVAPEFEVAEKDTEILTSNATQMIGSDRLNGTGYTGKGMRIAIIDTGIVVNHPSFQALEESKLTDTSLTQSEVDEVWESLNASKTNLRQAAYQNSKIPFAFNYVSLEFEVGHSFAGHDHGTHVAGIAAANKVKDSNVVGVAPDAQLLVMQVFERTGGASWTTIMAALEDALLLDADAVNLSLGSPAGFSNSDPELAAVIEKYKNTDTQVLIAAGNDTNNGYMNRTGTDMSKKENPDHGLVGTPATVPAAFAVASVDNEAAEMLYFTVGSHKIGFQETAATDETNFFKNFRQQTKNFIVIDGVGKVGDYVGKDVNGKIVVVSRGEISFQEKQAIAKEQGAIAIVVYNNVPGSFSMLVSDGDGHIPCVGISQADGQKLVKEQQGSLTVCNGEMITVQMGKAMSSFSSWGVTPDLKIKPEISGVGGGIYSTRDPLIGGSYYGDMSGTSMATPQVSGAMAVLLQYLKETYPDVQDDELRKVAANLMLSTASQVETGNLPYSVRNQGAGLVNLENAVAAGAYLSNPNAEEGRPLGEMGDSDTGTFTFHFSITNFDNKEETYVFDSVVMTPKLKDNTYMSDDVYKLNSKVTVKQGNEEKTRITLPAKESIQLTATITLSQEDITYLRQYPEGIYVEGYLYARTPDVNDKRDLSMPFLGFYGDWSEPDVFDEEGDNASLYGPVIYTRQSKLGTNPYINNGKSGNDYNAISYANPLDEMSFGMMRNSKKVEFKVTSEDNSQTYFEASENNIIKTYFDTSYGMIIPYVVYNYIDLMLIWDGTNQGAQLLDGTKAHYTISSYLDDNDDVADDVYAFDVTIDNQKPIIKDADALSNNVILDEEAGTVTLPITLQDNHYIAAVMFENSEGVILGRFELDGQTPGTEMTKEFDVTGYGSHFTVIVADYACNEVETDVILDLSDMPVLTEPKPLDSNRIYGNETYNAGPVSIGWFSADKDSFTNLRNETYDPDGRSYSGEYINGYVIAQRASDGALLLYTPYNTYWSARTLLTQEGTPGDDGFKVLYDMAMNYENNKLYAIGWLYRGDNDGDGKDDGGNMLFEIQFQNNQVSISDGVPVDVPGTIEGLTLGCTTEGQLYTISGDGKLYKLGQDGKTTLIDTTDFVNVPNYSGVNVIQSMGYDHDAGKMYWYAHSQTLSANEYISVCKTYEVNLEDASCKEIGSAGQSGHTSLFVPTQERTTLFEMNVDPTDFAISDNKLTMAKGQTRRVSVKWMPWNAKEQRITWESENDAVASVNTVGHITANAAGTTTITAETQLPSGTTVKKEIQIEVVGGSGNLYGFVITDYKNSANELSWITYPDSDPQNVTRLKGDSNMWQGGTYYNGYLYTVVAKHSLGEPVKTSLYKSEVTEDLENPGKTKIGTPQLINTIEGIEVGNMAFDYNTARMYGVDYTNGGLCIIDIESGGIDLMGTFTGDLGPAIMPAMCVTDTGRIIGSDMFGGLYEVDPDTMYATKIGSISSNTFYYAAMTFDYNSKCIYWNPCMDANDSDLYMIRLKSSNPSMESEIEIIKLDAVSTDAGVEQTVMFTVPENEPETTYVPIESIKITNGDLVGLTKGTLQLTTETTPKRPSVKSKQWSSSNPEVASVDHFGKLSFKTPGETTITVSVEGKAPGNQGPFTNSIQVTVYESAGEMVAFLASDEGASSFYDYWLKICDYDIQHAELLDRMIDGYSLRTGEYYDGYIYAYNDRGQLCKINAENYADNMTIANHNLGAAEQIVNMAFNYVEGKMYALTLPQYPGNGKLATIDLNTGKVTTIATTSHKVTTLAVDKYGTMYAAGSSDFYSTAVLYTIDPETAVCTEVETIDGAVVYTGANYMSDIMYNSQMTYDYDTNRMYLHATTRHKNLNSYNSGMFLIQLKENTAQTEVGEQESTVQVVDRIQNLGKLAINTGSTVKVGNAYLGLMCYIPDEEQLPDAVITGIQLNRNIARIQVGDVTKLTASIVPSNAEKHELSWTSQNPEIATVDQNGNVTAVAEGNTVIEVSSTVKPEIKATCTITVVKVPTAEETTVAYTISASQDSLIAFNPEFPVSTAKKVATVSGGKNIAGVAVKDSENLYYLVYDPTASVWPQLRRYNSVTKQSSLVGYLHVFIGDPADIAYDPVNKLIYVVSGFYIFQFEERKLTAADVNPYAGILDLTTTASGIAGTHAVTCINGDVYVLVSNNEAKLYKVNDRLKNMEFVRGLNINTISGESQMDYDSRTGYFYITDSGERIWRFTADVDNIPEMIDILGKGWDLNGLALDTNLGEVPGELPEDPETPGGSEEPPVITPGEGEEPTEPENPGGSEEPPVITPGEGEDPAEPENPGEEPPVVTPGEGEEPTEPENPGEGEDPADMIPVELKEGTSVKVLTEDILYGDRLGDILLGDGVFVNATTKELVEGTCTWVNPEYKPEVGTTTVEWIFTPKDKEYDTLQGKISITVQKSIPMVEKAPTVSERVYDPAAILTNQDLIGGMVKDHRGNEVKGSWTWLIDDITPVSENTGYTAVFTPEEFVGYKGVTAKLSVVVTKAVPYVKELPIAATILSGQSLANATLIGGSVQYSENQTAEVQGEFIWKDSKIVPSVADSDKTPYTVTFVPKDDKNYQSVDVTVTVSVQAPPNEDKKLPTVGTKLKDADGIAWYKVTAIKNNKVEVSYVKPVNAKSKTVKIPKTVVLSDGTGASVTSIAAKALKGNKNVTTVTIGGNITTIGKQAFANCKKLQTVKLGAKVHTIQESAFAGSGKLASITLGKQIKKIGKRAFYNCKSLNKIVIKSTKLTEKNVAKQAFAKVGTKKLKVKVPSAKLKVYTKLLKSRGITLQQKITK